MLAGTRCCVQDYDSNDDGSDTGAADLENLVRWAPLGSCTRMRFYIPIFFFENKSSRSILRSSLSALHRML